MLEPGSFSLVDLRCRHGWRFDQLCLTSDRRDSILDRHRGSTRLSQQGRCPWYGLQKQMHFGLLVSIAYSVRKPMFELPWLLVGQPALRWKRCYRVYHVLTHCLPSPINTTLKAIALESAQGQEKRSYFMCSCCCLSADQSVPLRVRPYVFCGARGGPGGLRLGFAFRVCFSKISLQTRYKFLQPQNMKRRPQSRLNLAQRRRRDHCLSDAPP